METYILEGNISVKAAILANRRTVHKIYVDQQKKDKDTQFILHRAMERDIPIEYQTREFIDQLAQGKTHGGLLALCGERDYQTIASCCHEDHTFLCLLEGIEDPFNFGQTLRSLYAAGCQGIIIPPRNWTSAAGVVAKSSAGASEYVNLIIAEDMEAVLATLQNHHIALLCAQRKDAVCLYDYTFPQHFCVAIGGEMRGLSKTVSLASEQNLYIPYAQDFKNAMSTSSSTAIIAFEYLRQSKQYLKK